MDRDTVESQHVPMYMLRAGLMVFVPRENVGVSWPDHVVVAGCYAGTDEYHAVTDVPTAGLERWLTEGIPIQDALPGLSDADRLFVQCGSKVAVFAG